MKDEISKMNTSKETIRISIIGGGPTALLMFQRLIEQQGSNFTIDIFEKKKLLGAGMPYSRDGALEEHITNVSGNEIPYIFNTVEEWISSEHRDTLNRFKIEPSTFNEYKVLPRLLFGRYLSDQFQQLIKKARQSGLEVNVHLGCEVIDIVDDPAAEVIKVVSADQEYEFDKVLICSGHRWPKTFEGSVEGYFDSPYPPQKLSRRTNHPVAIRGSSLTAIDAIRTLARSNGQFINSADGPLQYIVNHDSPDFKMIMHSRNGFLPAVRFHLQDSHLSKGSVLSQEEVEEVMKANSGFLPLDYVYRRNFLEPLSASDPEFYHEFKSLSIEDFVERMLAYRESVPAFELLEREIAEAEKSIRERKSVNWKEMLAVLSFTMNYPAKHFSAEDMQRLKHTLMPLISVVIAFAPQSSVYEMMALFRAGVLDIVAVGNDSEVTVAENTITYTYTDPGGTKITRSYATFIDAIGQPHLNLKDVPFPSLIRSGTVSSALLKFRDQESARKAHNEGDGHVIKYADGHFYQLVSGVAINDAFQVLDAYGACNERIYMLAVPYIGGYNPDFSGLDFGEAASARVVRSIFPDPLEKEIA